MKALSIAYLPPKGFPGADSFVQNIKKFPPSGELILFSDHDWPGAIKLRASVDIYKQGGSQSTFIDGEHTGEFNPFARHNAIWLAACKIAIDQGATHMLYIEADCRVGKAGWDAEIFEEYFNLGGPKVVAGTLTVYNPCNPGVEAARRAHQLTREMPRHGVPVAQYGWFSASAKQPSCVFPNGALAVYDLLWMSRMWDLPEMAKAARQNTAFDMAIGQHLWNKFDIGTYDLVGYLQSVYSGFGDALTSPEQRRQMLLDGKVVAMHQEKGDWQP
jgi:hypothetical protein